MKVLITTMASSWYKALIPIFTYTAKRANPGCVVRVFDKDELFPKHADTSVGLLRFCVPNSYFHGYDYVYFTDVDFIVLPHKTNVTDYLIRIIKETGQPYAGYRGPRKGRWRGRNKRLAGGVFMATQRWFAGTEPFRKHYVKKCIKGIEYREKDEVYLQRMTTDAMFATPNKVGCFMNGERYNRTYHNIHLGDFKSGFRHRWENMDAMKGKWLLDRNIPRYLELTHDNTFNGLVSEAVKVPEVKKMFDHLTEHLQRRGIIV